MTPDVLRIWYRSKYIEEIHNYLVEDIFLTFYIHFTFN